MTVTERTTRAIGDAAATFFAAEANFRLDRIIAAARSGIPRAAVLRMVINVGVDTLVGSLPVLGDVFDFAYKSNSKNLELYRQHLRGERSAAKDWVLIALTIVVLAVIAAIPIVALIFLVQWLQHRF